MLNTLTLTNFRQHQSRSIDFTSGINCIRGINEAGKSSLLESIAYVLFGSRTLRTPLEGAVTWGEPISSLKVELSLTTGGKTYNYKRSKSGAEVSVGGSPYMTGQKEVTNLSAELLGADAAVASRLLVAGQGGIRGALEEGPAALSALIEELASMSLFDQILDAAGERLALGSPALIEARLKGAQDTLEAATQNLPPKPDDESFVAAQTDRHRRKDALNALIPALDGLAKEANTAWQSASRLYLQRTQLEQAVTDAENRVRLAKNQVSVLPVATPVDTSPIARLQQEIAEAEDHAKRLDAYRVFQSIPDGPYWVGSRESFEVAVKKCSASIQDLKSQVQALMHEIKTVESGKFNDHKCSKCGQDLPNLDFIQQKNDEARVKITELEARRSLLLDELKMYEHEEVTHVRMGHYAKECDPIFRKLLGYVLFDDDTYPMKVVWKGSIPEGSAPDTAPMKKEIARIEVEVKSMASATAKLELAIEQLIAANAAYDKTVAELDEFVSPTPDKVMELTAAKDQALLDLNAAKGTVILLAQEIDSAAANHNQAHTLWKMAKHRIDDAQKTIEACQSDLNSLTYNNNFVKRIRAIRPVIANKLWSTVLASVSVMFSQMRKEESWVTKEKDGFKVNGQAVESLSGSTLDLLGLAIRCALLRTFLPQCGLLVLDEPCASMDTSRTEALLGFLVSFDFQQTILVTHDSVSSTVCENLIEL